MSTTTPEDPKSALEQAKTVFIRYPRLNELHQDIRRCRLMSENAGESQSMALEGATGTGKTTFIKRYEAQFPRRETATGTVIPVFYLETPSPVTVKMMAEAMLEQLGDPAAHTGTIGSLNSRLVKLLIACQVELVIFDDFHHLIDTETDRVLAKVSEWLKVLIKETGIPFLVVGIEGKVERILQANPQLSRLFAVRETLYPFRWDTSLPSTIDEFNTFVATAEKSVGQMLDPDIQRIEMLYRVFYATNGVVSNVMNLLRFAIMLAEEQQQSKLSLPILAQAFEKRIAKHTGEQQNPFVVPPQERFAAPLPLLKPSLPEKKRGRGRQKTNEPSLSEALSAH